MKKILFILLLPLFGLSQTIKLSYVDSAGYNQISSIPVNLFNLKGSRPLSPVTKGTNSQFSVVSFGSRFPYISNAYSNGTDTISTSRMHHVAVGNISDLHVAYGNFGGLAATFPDVTGSDVTIQASIEYPAGTFTNVYFNGALRWLLRLRSIAISDAIPLCIPDRADFWVRTLVVVQPGQKWVCNQATWIGYSEGTVANTNSVNSGVITASTTNCFGPIAVLGLSTTNHGSIVWIGDSLTTGTGDSGAGTSTATPYQWGAGLYWRAFGSAYPGLMANVAGQKIAYWNPTNATSSIGNFQALLSTCQYAISNLGVNDFSGGTALQLEQSWINLWAPLKARGLTVYQTTLTPKTTSTDAWATLANQTTTTGEATRVAANTWLRAGAPYDYALGTPVAVGSQGATVVLIGSPLHPLAGIIDIGGVAESSLNSGKWILGGTADGTHMVPAIYASAAVLITAIIGKFNKY